MVHLTYERLLQLLSASSIELNTLQQQIDTEMTETLLTTIRTGLQELSQMTSEAITLVRNTLADLPPPELEVTPLPELLARMVEETAERLDISSRIAITGVDEQNPSRKQALSPQAEHVLYHLSREILYEIEHIYNPRRLRLALNYGERAVQMNFDADSSSKRSQANEPQPAPPFTTTPSSTPSMFTTIFQALSQRFVQLGGSLRILEQEEGLHIVAHLPYAEGDEQESSPKIPPLAAPSTPLPTAPRPVRILIVDSQTVTRAGLRRLLDADPTLEIIGEAADGVQAASETVELGPQVVLMDTRLPGGQTLEALRQIKQLNPDTRVLMLATDDREEYLYETLRAGADGYVLKDIAPEELVRAIQTVARGEVVIQSQLAGKLLTRYGKEGRQSHSTTLTAREQEVLRLLARGLRNKEIAARLYVSERTVNFHLANIYQKLNVSGRTEALSRALEQGLITP